MELSNDSVEQSHSPALLRANLPINSIVVISSHPLRGNCRKALSSARDEGTRPSDLDPSVATVIVVLFPAGP